MAPAAVPAIPGAALGHGSQKSKRYQEVPLICTDHFACCCPTGNRELLGPSLDSPSTDSTSILTTASCYIPLPAQRPSMEVITMPPPAISPTEGDDLFEVHVTSVAIHSVTLLICLCGLAGNVVVLWVQSRKSICYIFNQAFDNFFFLLFMVLSTLLFLVEDMSCSIIMPPVYFSFLFQLSVVSYYMGLYQLMFIDTKRCRSLHYEHCYPCHLPQNMLWVVMRALQWAFFYSVIAVHPIVTSLCQTYEHKHCWGALISTYTLNLFLFGAAVVISSTILFIKAKRGPQQEQPKRLDIIIFYTELFHLPVSICNFLQQLGNTTVSTQVVFLLICIHYTIKPFIYLSVRSCWWHCRSLLRVCLQRIFEWPKDSTACSSGAAMDTGV
ncbi:mas-related G-protein coupled receptor member H-like [Anomalospiza imberbis]|uniref:mas-related G-protein coupled receptor member H-like n=1 Tax=Anomalospiza imberbis TaxID=187417 RepID=UPI00358FCC08